MEIRELKQKELKVLRNALRYFRAESFLRTHRFFVVENERKNLFMCTPEVYRLISGQSSGINFVWAGVKTGEITSRKVRFTLEGAYYLAGKKDRIFVSSKGEMLFLYGRDILASSVQSWDRSIKENYVVFVANNYGDILGIGRLRHPPEKISDLDPDEIAVENLVDRGEYLRKNRLYDAF